MAKKITRAEKVELSRKGVCWKCKGKLEKINGGKEQLCKHCGLRFK